MLFNKAVNC